MEEALISMLLADTAVAAIVGNRVFVGRRRKSAALPTLVIHRISGAPEYAEDGEVGVAGLLFQIDCWAETYGQAKLLARAVTETLSAFSGTIGAVEVQFITLDAERDDAVSGTADDITNPFRTSLDFEVWRAI